MQVVTGYVNVYFKRGDYGGALAVLDWALAFYPGLAKPGEPNFLDKGEAALLAIRSEALLRLGDAEGAAESLRRAELRRDAAALRLPGHCGLLGGRPGRDGALRRPEVHRGV